MTSETYLGNHCALIRVLRKEVGDEGESFYEIGEIRMLCITPRPYLSFGERGLLRDHFKDNGLIFRSEAQSSTS